MVRTLKRNPVSELIRERARELRRNSTAAENKLWRVLRSYGTGVKFRRQYPIGPYIADFYSPDLALVIEVDGETHDSEQAKTYDRLRDEYLQDCGLTVKRFSNAEVLAELARICGEIDRIIASKRG